MTAVATTRRLRRLANVLAISVGLAACSGPQSTLDPAGPAATAIARTWWLMFSAGSAILILVVTLVLYAMFRQQRPVASTRPERFIVVGGLILPTTALLALLIYGTAVGGKVIGIGLATDQVVQVTARQWQWQFDHLDRDGNVLVRSFDELKLPSGRMVEFRVDSEDVIHSFWIPRLGGKIDAIPGQSNRLRLQADRLGTMRGQCAEFCGLDHAHMHFRVEIVEPDVFDAWLHRQHAEPVEVGG